MKSKWLIFPFLLLLGCNEKANNMQRLTLKPLNPFSYEFKSANQQDNKRHNYNEYYFLSGNLPDLKILGRQLNLLVNQKKKNQDSYQIQSLYIYKETSILNENFKGNREQLSGVHDNDLIAYLRWVNGKQDIFYILKDGIVVYDALNEEKMQTPFEFD